MNRPALTMAVALLALAGCRTQDAYRRPFPRPELSRPPARDGRVWVGQFELGQRRPQVLHVVAAPEVLSLRLVEASPSAPADFHGYEGGLMTLTISSEPERRWLIECGYEGGKSLRVGSVDVVDGALLIDCGAGGGGTGRVVAVGPPGFLPFSNSESAAQPCSDLNEALAAQEGWLQRRAERRASETNDPGDR